MSKNFKNILTLLAATMVTVAYFPASILAQDNNQISVKDVSTSVEESQEVASETTLGQTQEYSAEQTTEETTTVADPQAKTQDTIPNELVGIWQFGYQGKPFAVTAKSIYLNDKLYDVTSVTTKENNGYLSVVIEWDTKKFAKNYGEESVVDSGPFEWTYDSNMDTLIGSYTYYRQMDRAFIDEVKKGLLEDQPINEELLNKVMYNSLNAYNTIADGSDVSQKEYNQYIYESIAKDYPELKLLTGESYDAYLKAAEQLSDFSLADLNKTNPANLLKVYNDLSKKHNGDAAKINSEIKPIIEKAIKTYDKRLADAEKRTTTESESNQESSQESTSGDEETKKDETSTDGENVTGVKAEAIAAVKAAYPKMAGDKVTYIVSTDSEDDNFIVVEVYEKGSDKLNLMGIFNYSQIDETVQQIQ